MSESQENVFYHLISFEDGTAICPNSWIETREDNGVAVVCTYPPQKELKFIRKYVSQSVPPGSHWESHSGSILKSSNDLKYLQQKSQKYEQKGSVTTDCEGKRPRPKMDLYIDSSRTTSSPIPSMQITNTSPHATITPNTSPLRPNSSQSTSFLSPLACNNTPQPIRHDQRSSTTSENNNTNNLNFSKFSLSKTKNDIENKLGCSLSTTEGLVHLLVSQQLFLSKIQSQLSHLAKEVTEIKSTLNNNAHNMHTPSDFDLSPVTTFKEYIQLAENLCEKDFKKNVIRYLAASGGQSLKEVVGRTIPKLLTHEMQTKINMSGAKMAERAAVELQVVPTRPLGFKMCLLPVVIRSAQLILKTDVPSESAVEVEASKFLRRAMDRQGGRERRRKSTVGAADDIVPKKKLLIRLPSSSSSDSD